MNEFLGSTTNVIVDRTPDELIGAVLLAVIVALVVTGLYRVGRRKTKSDDNAVLITSLVLFANLVTMALAAGYVIHVRKNFGLSEPSRQSGMAFRGEPIAGHQGSFVIRGAPPSIAPGPPPVFSIVEAADTDQDGRLSPDEAAFFVRTLDIESQGSIHLLDIIRALEVRPMPSPRVVAESPQRQASDELR